MAASSCMIRPQDCFRGGNTAFLEAHCGVHAAPAPAPRRPMQQQDGNQVPTKPPLPGQSRPPVRRRPNNGRQRGRRSPSAAGSPTQKKPVMENVVILKRGEQVQPNPAVAPLAAEKADEPVAAVNQSGAQAEKVVKENAEPVITGPGDTEAKKAEEGEHHSAKVLAATKKRGGRGVKPKAAPPVVVGYSDPSFAAAPEPRELPIPVRLLKGQGMRLFPRE